MAPGPSTSRPAISDESGITSRSCAGMSCTWGRRCNSILNGKKLQAFTRVNDRNDTEIPSTLQAGVGHLGESVRQPRAGRHLAAGAPGQGAVLRADRRRRGLQQVDDPAGIANSDELADRRDPPQSDRARSPSTRRRQGSCSRAEPYGDPQLPRVLCAECPPAQQQRQRAVRQSLPRLSQCRRPPPPVSDGADLAASTTSSTTRVARTTAPPPFAGTSGGWTQATTQDPVIAAAPGLLSYVNDSRQRRRRD